MISFNYLDLSLDLDETGLRKWIDAVAQSEGYELGDVNYIFCTDEYLHDLNLKYLNHDTLTDVIGFDNSVGNNLHGDIFISVERVKENATTYQVEFEQELARVMIHGILHFCGYTDKDERGKEEMTGREDYHLERRSEFS